MLDQKKVCQSISLAGKRISLRIFHSTPYWQTAETGQLVTDETHTHGHCTPICWLGDVSFQTDNKKKRMEEIFHQFAL